MKKLLLSTLAVATVAGGIAVPAQAQRYGNWQTINQRQDNLYRRIEQGVRNGTLTRGEANRLRSRFVELDRLESRYRRNGLSSWERRDLDQRFDALSRQIRWERNDRQDRRYR